MSVQARLLGALALGLFTVCLALPLPTAEAQSDKHKVIHAALRETHRAHYLVGKLKPIYGGHRKAALKHMEEAIKEMKLAIKFVKEPDPKLPITPPAYDKPKGTHPVIRRAEAELRAAHANLKPLKPIYGGHRAKAMGHLTKAVDELNKAIKFIDKESKK